jgi:redox-sensitive bicupin YhaK (pirin superfamily)
VGSPFHHIWLLKLAAAKYKMTEPQYHELDAENIPSAYPEGPDGPVQIKVIAGKSFDKESPVKPLGIFRLSAGID